jgi:hypothetical protein
VGEEVGARVGGEVGKGVGLGDGGAGVGARVGGGGSTGKKLRQSEKVRTASRRAPKQKRAD